MVNPQGDVGYRFRLTDVIDRSVMEAHETGGFENSSLRNLTPRIQVQEEPERGENLGTSQLTHYKAPSCT